MNNKKYCIAHFYLNTEYFTDEDEIWCSLPTDTIMWLRNQDFDKFIVEQVCCNDYTNTPRSSVKTKVYVEFLDKMLETQFLLKFGEKVINSRYVCI